MVNSNSEIGGYLELWENRGKMLHEGAIALNSGRSCLEYLIRARGIKKILLPYYLCDSLEEICKTGGGYCRIRHYHIDRTFTQVDTYPEEDEWLYLVKLLWTDF